MVAITSNTAILASTVFTLAQLATAQSTSTVSLFVYDADPQPLVASVVGADAAATTYAIVCPDGTDSNHCGLPSPWTMTYGSTYYEVQTTEADVFSVSARCEFQTSTGDRTCTVSLGGSAANFPGLTTETLAATDVAKNSLPVVITAGLDKLAAATGGAAATTGSAASAGSSSGVPSSASNAGSSGTFLPIPLSKSSVGFRRSSMLTFLQEPPPQELLTQLQVREVRLEVRLVVRPPHRRQEAPLCWLTCAWLLRSWGHLVLEPSRSPYDLTHITR